MNKLLKRIISIALVSAFVFGMQVPLLATTVTSVTNTASIKALALKQIGLMQGVSATENNFELDRAPTRVEALVILIRALGKDAEALRVGGTHPFKDVPEWADNYIGYAYEQGLTKGTSPTTLGTGAANANMYLTFMLRALGYSDTEGDFAWDKPSILAKAVGILPNEVDTENFLRADVVLISWAALDADLKGGSTLMAKKLVREGAIDADSFFLAVKMVNETSPVPVPVSVDTVELLERALSDSSIKAIDLDAVMCISDELTIPAGVTVTLNRGNDLNVEGTLINNGKFIIKGADEIDDTGFINYSVVNIRGGGKFINNGLVDLGAAYINDNEDRGPIGGQLRVFSGSAINNGAILLQAALTNTQGGILIVAEGPLTNNGVIIVDGFQIIIANTLTNNTGGVIINNTYICTRGEGTLVGEGTLTGNTIVKE